MTKNPRTAIGATALAGLTALGGVGAMLGGQSDNGLASARINVTEVATTTTKSPSGTSADEAAAQLFDLLPPGYSPSNCSVPADGGVKDSTVTLDCGQATTPNGPSTATFALFPNQRLLDKHFQGFVSEDKISECPGGIKSPGNWHYNDTPDVAAGRIACGTFQGTPDLIWTQNADLMIGNIQGNDIESLYNYWANPSGNAQAPNIRQS